MLVGLAIFVLAALIKPWAGAATNHSRDDSRTVAGAYPAASTGQLESTAPTPTPGPNAMSCLAGDIEQVVILERTASGRVQSWIAAVDQEAQDPVDLDLIPLSVFSIHVVGVGVCAPDREPSGASNVRHRQAAIVVEVRLVGARGASGVVLGAPRPLGGQLGGPSDALLFGAPEANAVTAPTSSAASSAGGSSARSSAPSASPAPAPSQVGAGFWPTGSYAIGYAFDSDPPGRVRWVRLDLAAGVGAAG